MTAFLPDTTLDAALDEIATCTRLDVVSDTSTPTDLTNTLGNVTLTAGDGNGDYVIADGDVSGRKLTVGAQSDFAVTGTGDAKHIVLSLGGTIKAIATCTTQTLTSGNTVSTPAFDIEITDPS